MDKIQKDLLAAGIDEETVKEMVRNLERKATEKQVKTITFNKPTVEVTAVTVEVNKPSVSNGEVKEPFNPANLKFGS
jgi:helix-turn-helix protein